MVDKFWVDDPCILFTDFALIPNKNMTKNEKLNTLTRWAIIISAVMYAMGYEYWFTFLILALLLILILKYTGDKNEPLKEGFTVTPTYQGLDFQQTSVAPLFAEEWQIYPPAYDLYANQPPPATFQEPLMPQSYPYGQYLTRTNLLPTDEYYTHMLNGGPRQAREYANSAFLRHSLASRDNFTKLYKKSLARRYRQNCNDVVSPYYSY